MADRAGDQPGNAGKQPGAARIIKAYRVLAMVMKHAVFSKRIATSPCHDHELPRPMTRTSTST
ncbi:hypothetical protein [Streptomyces ipomoeae]|uniref:hypothetical protein n=1 Tax=Streptomyces ipomoeae TaxID=103232 RepID=UPI0011477494|nr:hypothetical protein [Streptomyces ipomoeae]MDX2933045.1 hypothetical protein [Streptomyces ipomoeae]TQE16553.1 hypothetical protein SipoB123_40655 [Streptomyces ipomoeae]